ncbi:transcriptional repressor [Aristophania vespae]|uniref:Transcriptional repressor n=2 Tax=Aristophania vespae TaxID=2697033 RepID=A0A6P1NBS7_9PROT|nr:transcriptional repressor [Aristophania vespae]
MVMSNNNTGRRRSPPNGEVVGDSPIARLCIENGLKMTGQRRVIAYVLSQADDHPDVEELYRRASMLDSRISVATVYRTVRLLEEKGILERRDFGGGRARYEATEHGRHYHLIDIDSGRVVEFEGDELVRLLSQIASKFGYELVSNHVELFGKKCDSEKKETREASMTKSQSHGGSGLQDEG